jgi:hypothetical protein
VADDIVTRLRHIHMELTVDDYDDVISEAADEIERLRAAGDALVTAMQSGSDAGWDAAIDAWQEARRG